MEFARFHPAQSSITVAQIKKNAAIQFCMSRLRKQSINSIRMLQKVPCQCHPRRRLNN